MPHMLHTPGWAEARPRALARRRRAARAPAIRRKARPRALAPPAPATDQAPPANASPWATSRARATDDAVVHQGARDQRRGVDTDDVDQAQQRAGTVAQALGQARHITNVPVRHREQVSLQAAGEGVARDVHHLPLHRRPRPAEQAQARAEHRHGRQNLHGGEHAEHPAGARQQGRSEAAERQHDAVGGEGRSGDPEAPVGAAAHGVRHLRADVPGHHDDAALEHVNHRADDHEPQQGAGASEAIEGRREPLQRRGRLPAIGAIPRLHTALRALGLLALRAFGGWLPEADAIVHDDGPGAGPGEGCRHAGAATRGRGCGSRTGSATPRAAR
mmetsp:Transcript_46204/g.130080  ORF Transcript_46204/g.130080 Transcript_46204/m.130080 type:complete len:331 (+) Transcript_46204:144-1136(+)